jgi:O-antigen/teichoic acid export membrane protein
VRTPVRDTTALALGSFGNAALAYVFFTVATRTLGAEAAAPVSVLWTYWLFAGAALTFPVQHWIARTVAAHRSETLVHDALPAIAAAVATAAALTGFLAWLARGQLFHREDVWFPLLIAGVTVGSGFVGVVRGGLSARYRFGSVALALLAENALRCAAAAVLVVAAVRSPLAFGVCMVLGSAVGLLWPSAFRFSTSGSATTYPRSSAFGFLGAAAGGQLIGQAVLTGGPVLLALRGGTPASVTALFAGLALFRAPYTLAIGVLSQLTGRLTTLVVEGRRAELGRVRLLVLAGTVFTTAVAAAIGGLVGPWLLRAIFGQEVQLSSSVAALVAAGSAVALANLVQTVGLLAQSRSGAVTRAWLLGLVGGAGVLVLLTTDLLAQTAWAFTVTEAVAFVAFAVEELRGARNLPAGVPANAAPAASV